MEIEDERLYTLPEAAKFTGLPLATLSMYARRHFVPAAQYGTEWKMFGKNIKKLGRIENR